jgi:hypothetical protein
MTRDDIIRMAQECHLIGMRPHLDGLYQESIEQFAALVAAHETEACAKLCHAYAQTAFNSSSQNAAVELRDAIWSRRQG